MSGANGAWPTSLPSRSNTTISISMRLAGEQLRPRSPSRHAPRHRRAPYRPLRAWAKASAAVLAARMRLRKRGRAAGPSRELGEHAEIDRAAPRMQIEQALRELGHLAEAAGDGDARHRMAAQIFQHAADEIAHVDQRDLGQAVQLLHRRFGRRAGRAGDMGEAGGARHVDAAMDRVDPGRAGIGHDDAGGAEDRQAADDAEPRRSSVLAASASPPGMEISTSTSPASAMRGGDLGDRRRASSGAAPGLIAGSPGGMGRPGRVTVPTPSPARKVTPLPGAPRRTVARISAPWVTSGSSPASLTTPAVAAPSPGRCGGQGEGRALAARQGHLHRIGKFAGQQRRIGGLGGGGGAGAGGPAIAEGGVFGGHAPRYSAPEGRRHGRRTS